MQWPHCYRAGVTAVLRYAVEMILIVWHHLQKHDIVAAISGIMGPYVGVSMCTVLDCLEFLLGFTRITMRWRMGSNAIPPDAQSQFFQKWQYYSRFVYNEAKIHSITMTEIIPKRCRWHGSVKVCNVYIHVDPIDGDGQNTDLTSQLSSHHINKRRER